MKNLKLFIVALLLPFIAGAQTVTVNEGTIKMGKTKLKGFTTTYNWSKKQVVDNMEKNIDAANIKRSSRKKGFSIYKGAAWPLVSANKADYYYKAKTKKGHTILLFAASKGYDNYVTTATDANMTASIIAFLQNMDTQIGINEKIEAKQEDLKKMEETNKVLTKQKLENAQQMKRTNSEIQKLQPAYPTK